MTDVQFWQAIAGGSVITLVAQSIILQISAERQSRVWAALIHNLMQEFGARSPTIATGGAGIKIRGLPDGAPTEVFNHPHDLTDRA